MDLIREKAMKGERHGHLNIQIHKLQTKI